MRFSSIEIRDIVKSWLAVTLAFTVADIGLTLSVEFILILIISAITAGLGFIVHELSHKWLAQHYGCQAEFRSNDKMLIFSIILSLLGVVFIAPGAVLLMGHITQEKNGKISAAGTISNLILALIFLVIGVWVGGTLSIVAYYGMSINTWLAIFNMLPFPGFDGVKVLRWNKIAYIAILIFSGVLSLLFPLIRI